MATALETLVTKEFSARFNGILSGACDLNFCCILNRIQFYRNLFCSVACSVILNLL